jgi:hypothetical protein
LCHSNQLETLKGVPTTVKRDFWCHYNQLETLEGAPTTVGESFMCCGNDRQFTEEEVRAVCDVKREIYV